MCQRGRTGAHSCAQSIRRQAGAPSVQFSPVNLRNFAPVLTAPANEVERQPCASRMIAFSLRPALRETLPPQPAVWRSSLRGEAVGRRV